MLFSLEADEDVHHSINLYKSALEDASKFFRYSKFVRTRKELVDTMNICRLHKAQ
jgi:hypothetical protein